MRDDIYGSSDYRSSDYGSTNYGSANYGSTDFGSPELGSTQYGALRAPRLPSPGIAAVLAVLLPGLGHVYNGRLLAGAVWFLAISFGYWAILVPGLLLHAISVWTAFRIAETTERQLRP